MRIVTAQLDSRGTSHDDGIPFALNNLSTVKGVKSDQNGGTTMSTHLARLESMATE